MADSTVSALTASDALAGSELFYADGFAAAAPADVKVTATKIQTFARGGGGAVLLTSNDGGALGASGTAFSDLFLASGGVINWNAGDVTLTHASGALQLSSASQFGWSTDLILTRKGAANIQLGAVDAASPVAQTLSVQNVATGTSNTAGADFTISGSQGTGTGIGGRVIVQGAIKGGSGTSQNALGQIATFSPNSATQAVLDLNPLVSPAAFISIAGDSAGGTRVMQSASSTFISIGNPGIAIDCNNSRLNLVNYIGFQSSFSNIGSNVDLFVRRSGAANLALGAVDAASPVAQTLSVQNVVAGTTDTAGADFTISASQGTGTGVGGKILLKYAKAAGGSGSSQNSLTSRFEIGTSTRIYDIGGTTKYWEFNGPNYGSGILSLEWFRAGGPNSSCAMIGDNTGSGGDFDLRIGSGGRIQWGNTANSNSATMDLTITRRTTANLQLGVADAASPVAQTLSVQSVVAGTTDTAGAAFTINGSQSTGTGAGGSILLQTAKAAAGTGSSQNSLAVGLTVNSNGQTTLTHKVAVSNSSPTHLAYGGNGVTANQEGWSVVDSVHQLISAGACPVTLGWGKGIGLARDMNVLWGSNQFVAGGASGVTNDLFLNRRAAANLNLGAADAASPVAQTLSVQNVVAGTTDTAGVDFTISGSQSTGTAAGGKIIFKTSPKAGSTGSSQNALSSAWAIDSQLFLVPQVSMGTTMTQGFSNIVGAAGAATGTPATTTGFPVYWDSTNLQLYVYTGGAWKKSAAFT